MEVAEDLWSGETIVLGALRVVLVVVLVAPEILVVVCTIPAIMVALRFVVGYTAFASFDT